MTIRQPEALYVFVKRHIEEFRYAPDWSDARCAESDVDPEIFFPERSVYVVPLKAARNCCRECMIRATCLKYAMDNQIPHGVWGGTTPNEREALRGFPWERMIQ